VASNGIRPGPARPGSWWRAALLAGVCAGAVGSVARGAEPGAPHAGPVRIPESIPVRRDAGGDAERGAPVRALVIVAALGIVAVVVALRYRGPLAALGRGRSSPAWFGRWARSTSPGGVQLVQSVRLTPRATVHVLRWNGGELLVGCSDQGLAVLERRHAAGSAPQVDEETEP